MTGAPSTVTGPTGRTGSTGSTGATGGVGPTNPLLLAFANTIGGIAAQYILPPISLPAWNASSGASYTNIVNISPAPMWQHAILPDITSVLSYVAPNTNSLSGAATLYFAAYGTEVASSGTVSV